MSNPLTPLQIVTPTGTRAIKAYTLPSRDREWAINPTRNRGGFLARGDLLERQSPYAARAELAAASLSDAYTLAYEVIADAEAATDVGTHEGGFTIAAFLGYEIEPTAHDTVALTLRWLPNAPDLRPRTPYAYASETTPTVDSTTPTADTYWTAP